MRKAGEQKRLVELTKGEMLLIREVLRKYPAGTELGQLYGNEFLSVDRKMTELLATIFDEQHGL